MYGTLNDRNRLELTIRSLSSIGRALCASTDLNETFVAVIDASVPALFAALRIETFAWEWQPAIVAGASVSDDPDAFHLTLEAGGEILGTLVVTGRGGRLDAIDCDIAADIGQRLAAAIAAARAIAREHHVADTLQRALLPQTLPQGLHVRASAAYLPGTEEAIVGGDWYDVFALPDGRTAFSIGDVVGHGLRAAVVMGEVRQAFRAAAVNPKSPSLVLERANTIVNMRADTAIVTAIFGILDNETSTVTYAVAGHPPPILATRSGTSHMLPASGIPLGVAESVYSHDWTFTLPPGALFTLYTDGLTEYSRDVARGEERLIAAVSAQTVLTSDNPAQAIVDRIFASQKNVDDVAALVLAVDDVASERFAFEFSAIPLAVPIVRRALSQYLEHHAVSGDDLYAALLAVGEAAANAVEHAYAREPGLVRITAEIADGVLSVDVHDGGRWKPAEQREERGRGIKIMRAVMDRIEIRTMQAQTHIHLTLTLGQTHEAQMQSA